MGVDKSRVVLISADRGATGSGYLIGGGLVLTAAHAVPADLGADVTLRTVDSDERAPCVVVWSDPGMDLALLEQQTWDISKWVRWGTLAGTEQKTCTIMGFPEFARRSDGRREIEQLTAHINPLSGSFSAGWVISGDFHEHSSSFNSLAGLSGAPVFVDDFLVGVVREYAHDSRRLLATRTDQLAESDSLRELLQQRISGPIIPETVELAGIVSAFPPRRGVVSAESILEAQAMTVPFQGRDEQLHRLESWCAGPGLSVCVCSAPPGAGKTRLALELVRTLAQRGWAAGILRRDVDSSLLRTLTRLQTPTLLVVDEADRGPTDWDAVLDQTTDRDAPTRILLLTRKSIHDKWWDHLQSRTHAAEARQALGAALTLELPPLDRDNRPLAFQTALESLGRLLNASPDFAEGSVPRPEEIASPILDERYDSFAAIQAAALHALLKDAPNANRLLTAVQEYERHHVRRMEREQSQAESNPETPAPARPQTQPDADEQGSLSTRGFGDRPAEADLLGRAAVVAAITDLLIPPESDEQPGDTPPDISGPTVVALEGPWGAGKTTMMRLVQKELGRRPIATPHRRWWQRWRWWPCNRKHLSVIAAFWVLHRSDSKKPQSKVQRWWSQKHCSESSPTPVIANFNPWAHQSNEQIWAGLTRAIVEAASPVLGGSGRARERYWLHRNRLRLERRRLLRALWRNLASPLLRVAVFALLPPLLAQLLKADQTYTVWHWTLTAPQLALLLPVALLAAGVVHTSFRILFGAARSFLPGDVLDGPVLSGALAPGMGATADSALRDPYYNARSGYLYLVQHDIRELLGSLRERGHGLIVFIDDLDRCTPGTTAQVFEAINLFLSGALHGTAAEGKTSGTTYGPTQCRFVIGLDPAVVAGHLDQAYKDLQPERSRPPTDDPSWGWTFLRKLIQLPVTLPPITDTGIDSALTGLLGAIADTASNGDVSPLVPGNAPDVAGKVEQYSSARASGGGTTEVDPSQIPQLQVRLGPVPEPGPDAERQEQVRALETNSVVRSLIRQRLTDQGDLSIREAKRLLTIWQFYLRVIGHKEGNAKSLSVDDARHLLIVAEIAARWPALQPCLRRPVDGRPGLHWLALGAKDDHAWTQALKRTGLDDEHHVAVAAALRALLQKHDGEQVAAVTPRL
ncbi:P-loop NTPase fold protein [Streptomyces sp. Marseille-Q5077]|uniref:P-loop NTPase fold protein n=1 Tax=Streptomyces sp. Marseille-Q5077 TaxID=3418995 RepID=UPI003D05E2A8